MIPLCAYSCVLLASLPLYESRALLFDNSLVSGMSVTNWLLFLGLTSSPIVSCAASLIVVYLLAQYVWMTALGFFFRRASWHWPWGSQFLTRQSIANWGFDLRGHCKLAGKVMVAIIRQWLLGVTVPEYAAKSFCVYGQQGCNQSCCTQAKYMHKGCLLGHFWARKHPPTLLNDWAAG